MDYCQLWSTDIAGSQRNVSFIMRGCTKVGIGDALSLSVSLLLLSPCLSRSLALTLYVSFYVTLTLIPFFFSLFSCTCNRSTSFCYSRTFTLTPHPSLVVHGECCAQCSCCAIWSCNPSFHWVSRKQTEYGRPVKKRIWWGGNWKEPNIFILSSVQLRPQNAESWMDSFLLASKPASTHNWISLKHIRG